MPSSMRTRLSQRLLRDEVTAQFARRFPALGRTYDGGFRLPPPSYVSAPESAPVPRLNDGEKVCIVGAGASGLYLAHLLTKASIPYDMLEASDRVGGRVYTYDFPSDPTTAHNYYDVGAMRIPDVPAMKITLDLLKELNVTTRPYYFKNTSCPNHVGGTNMTSQAMDEVLAPFGNAVQPFIDELNRDFDSGFKYLTTIADQFSTREYLRTQADPPMNADQILQIETLNTGTGMFDQAFSESVVDWYDFPSDADWYRVENGMTALVDALCANIASQPILNTEVKSIAMDQNNKVDVRFRDVGGKIQTRKYKAVFSSTSLGALQRIQLPGLGSRKQLDAIRNLAYDTSCKVGIKFRTAWWINKGKMTPKGGVSTSDLAIRSVAYPPWTDNDDPNLPTVMIASYTWHQDAVRLGSLITNSYSPPREKPENSKIIQLVIEGLVQLFQHPEITSDFLFAQLVDYHPWAWHNDPYCAGAYALFGPAQFSTLYPSLFAPLEGSDNNVFLMGEHASAHHAWLSGAFASAEAAFYTYFAPERVPPKSLQHSIAKKVRAEAPKKAMPVGNGKVPSAVGGAVQAIGSGEESIMSGLLGEVEDEVLYWMAQLAKQHPTDPLFNRL